MSEPHDWMAGMTDFQRAEVARLESRIVSFEKRWQSLEADWNDCRKLLAAMRQQRDEARRRVCELSLIKKLVYRKLDGVDGRFIQCKTPEEIAQVYDWDCFAQQEGGGA